MLVDLGALDLSRYGRWVPQRSRPVVTTPEAAAWAASHEGHLLVLRPDFDGEKPRLLLVSSSGESNKMRARLSRVYAQDDVLRVRHTMFSMRTVAGLMSDYLSLGSMANNSVAVQDLPLMTAQRMLEFARANGGVRAVYGSACVDDASLANYVAAGGRQVSHGSETDALSDHEWLGRYAGFLLAGATGNGEPPYDLVFAKGLAVADPTSGEVLASFDRLRIVNGHAGMKFHAMGTRREAVRHIRRSFEPIALVASDSPERPKPIARADALRSLGAWAQEREAGVPEGVPVFRNALGIDSGVLLGVATNGADVGEKPGLHQDFHAL